MDLRLVEYVLYLAGAVPLTLWAGRALHRGLQLLGLGGVALLLTVDGGVATPADVVQAVNFANAYAANFGNITSDTTITVGQGIYPQAVNVTNAANTYTFTNGTGSSWLYSDGSYVASNGRLHEEMKGVLAGAG